jgi:hypothetical protein
MSLKEKQIRSAVIDGDVVTLDISTKKFPRLEMKCDVLDFERWRDCRDLGRIGAFKQSPTGCPYAAFKQNGAGRKTVLFHRFVRSDLGTVDHINRSGVDNRRCNIRDGGNAVNQRNKKLHSNNKTGFRGVFWNKQLKKWQARITIYGKQNHLGCFVEIADAINARLCGEKLYWGDAQ